MAYMWRAFSPAEGNGRPFTHQVDCLTQSKGIRGYDENDGMLVPDPRSPLPGCGDWRTQATPRVKKDGTVYVPRTAKVKRAKCSPKGTTVYVGTSGRTDGDYVKDDLRFGERKERSVRERVRAAVAAGHIAREDAPRWALTD